MCYYYPDASKLGGAIMAGKGLLFLRMLLVAGLYIYYQYGPHYCEGA